MSVERPPLLEAALEYLNSGLSLVPLKTDKSPLIKTKGFWSEPPTEAQLAKWFACGLPAQLGICCGTISRGGVWILDADDRNAVDFIEANIAGGLMPPTPRIVRTRRGKHFYYKNRPGFPVKAQQKKLSAGFFDIRGETHYGVAPPSRMAWHITDGKGVIIETRYWEYIWEEEGPWEDLQEYTATEFWKLVGADSGRRTDFPGGGAGEPRDPDFQFFAAADEGERNVRLTQAVGKLVWQGLAYDEVLRLACLINSDYNPPLPDKDVLTVAGSIWRTHRRNHPGGTSLPDLTDETLEDCLTFQEIAETAPSANEWLIDQSFLRNQLGIIYGAPGCGKGLFSANFIVRLACGLPVFGQWEPAAPVRCLVISGEDTTNIMHQRYRAVLDTIPEKKRKLAAGHVLFKSGDVSLIRQKRRGEIEPHEENLDWLKEKLTDYQPELLLLDTLTLFMGGDENDNQGMNTACSLLKSIIKDHSCNIILNHHTNKIAGDIITDSRKLQATLSQTSLRGASAIAGAIRWALMLVPLSTALTRRLVKDSELKASDGTYVMAKVVKKNMGPPEREIILSKADGFMTKIFSSEAAEEALSAAEADEDAALVAAVLEKHGEQSFSELKRRLKSGGMSEKHAQTAIACAAGQREIGTCRKGARTYYSIKKEEDLI
jgi:RecA-family ATPase